jgi:uncharacterized protein YbjQ (UPF0145 family)
MELIIFLGLLVTGFVVGSVLERRHYRSIRERERRYQQLVTVPTRTPAPGFEDHESQLVYGSVVVSVDYFKVTLAKLRQLIGGRVGAYETLLDRARREAILRMQEDARRRGANAIYNMRFETARISGKANKSLGSIEALAYGTALSPAS